uniref:Uncharacterized protein n=1 Tax=Chrysotila carterae TaxID=13221 RepID=A0A7S4B2X1_CHRCT
MQSSQRRPLLRTWWNASLPSPELEPQFQQCVWRSLQSRRMLSPGPSPNKVLRLQSASSSRTVRPMSKKAIKPRIYLSQPPRECKLTRPPTPHLSLSHSQRPALFDSDVLRCPGASVLRARRRPSRPPRRNSPQQLQCDGLDAHYAEQDAASLACPAAVWRVLRRRALTNKRRLSV